MIIILIIDVSETFLYHKIYDNDSHFEEKELQRAVYSMILQKRKPDNTTSATLEDDNDGSEKIRSRPIFASVILIGGLALLVISFGISISLGAADIDFRTVWSGIFQYDETLTTHQIIYELRLPRTLAAALVGASLAVSGAIMQGITRNPLASPSIMGISAGSAFMIAIALAFLPGTSYLGLMGMSFLGAGIAAAIVFGIGAFSKGGLTPVKLALAGTAVGAFLSSISSAIAIHYNVAQDMSFWYAGGVAGTQWISVQLIIPVAFISISLAMVLSRSITVLSLGDDVAKGLGQKTVLVKILGTLVVLLLTGAAVSVAGTIGFIGLVIPHITRFLVGMDYRWIIPCSAILGALLLVFADVGARMINAPYETPVGAITALIGVPFFLYLARNEGRGL
ncbi:ferrichrome transport system permease protein FhuB [Planococcus antarcticus DSM 14505]|uniref:Ferrichrome transport system permease protein FhuB n=1 Tax=Planococcus antarcticus DSM 14505 TaxID=1185653 RepID=A0AA87IHC0_9BACL|nr:iron ABC transporter permease [Planococcus antarcticus]EIM05120.1 ferrichrome transport system permease protein FhuB [Planococcus antarcticus DSM 14505]